MSAWILVPSLVMLRSEFNAVAPKRRKGADGAIGDSSHTSASDHTPDEDSDILRDHDADSKNEVHALDIDSAGPWPGGSAWFDQAIKGIVERERKRWLDPNDMCRLNYVIWNRRIADKDVNDFQWREYHGTADPHENHAHFSARYEAVAESDTSPWGLLTGGMLDMELDDLLWPKGQEPDSWKNRFPSTAPTVRNVLALSAYDFKDGANGVNGVRNDISALRAEIDTLKTLIGNLSQGGGGPVDVQAIAKAVADENARRQAE